jgi:phage-related protein (TIGR01555 family)
MSKRNKNRLAAREKPSVATQNAAADMYANPLANTGFGSSSAANGGDYVPFRISLDYQKLLNIYRGSWIVRAIVDTIPEDMLKEFPSLEIDAKPEEIEDFERVVAKTMTLQKIIEGLKWGRLFGGAIAIMILSGDSQKNLQLPLVLDEVQPDSYRGLIIVDRWSGVSPSSELISNIDNPAEYGLPEFYDVTTETNQNFRVHHSRVLRFIGRDLPLFEKQIQTYWGMSEIECVFEDLKRYDYCLAGITDLIARANVLVMKDPMLAQMLSGVGMTQTQYNDYLLRQRAVSESIGTNGILTLSQQGEFYSNSYSFGGLSDIGRMFMTQMCGASGYPMSRLFGQTNTGLGQSGEGDLQTYYDSVDQKRRRELRPIFDKLIPVICMSTYGEVPDDLDYNFPAIRSVTDGEKADLSDKATKSVVEAYQADLIRKRTAVRTLQRGAGELFAGITDEEAQAAPDKYASEVGGGELDLGGDNFGEGDDGKGGANDASITNGHAELLRQLYGLDINIETPAGAHRTGLGWSHPMPADYGEILGVLGADDDPLDCYVGPNPASDKVWVVDQLCFDGATFDEHKVMLGYNTVGAALADYMAGHNHSDQVFGAITGMSMAEFKKWIRPGRVIRPVAWR